MLKTTRPAGPATVPRDSSRRASSVPHLLLLVAIVPAILVLVYRPALDINTTWLDDSQYVFHNDRVLNPTPASAAAFLTEILNPTTVDGYYQPLTMLSLMLDSAAGGSASNHRPFHRTNLALHVTNATALGLLILALFQSPFAAVATALLFGLHPLTIEPVAWITERKTLLATAFGLSALFAYVQFTRVRSSTLLGRLWYVTASLSFLLALLAKPTLLAFPLLLLVLDYWPLDRLSRDAVIEKLPLLAVAAALSIIALISQQSTALIEYPTLSTLWPIALAAFYNVWFYIEALFWPFPRLFFYLRPDQYSDSSLSLGQPDMLRGFIGVILLALGVGVSVCWTRAVAAGFLFYVIALLPAIGVIRVATVIVSDKYAYFPLVGVFLVIGWAIARYDSCLRVRQRSHLFGRAALLSILVGLVAVEAVTTRHYLHLWRNSESLYTYVYAHSPQAWFLQLTLGDLLASQGQYARALEHYLIAENARKTTDRPPSAVLQLHLANTLVELDRPHDAVEHYQLALTLEPQSVETARNLAIALDSVGRSEDAVAAFRQVLLADPTDPVANNAIGIVLRGKGKPHEAVGYFRAAAKSDPTFFDARINLATELQRLGQTQEAISEYRAALALNRENAELHNNLAIALAESGQTQGAIAHLRRALQLNPGDAEIESNLRELLSR